MTVPVSAKANVAKDTANVGVQAQVVHGDVVLYQLSGDSSEDRYRIGVNYLDGGMPTKARESISAAMTEGQATSKVLFHWLLALLSGRTLRQFSEEDLSSLNAARKQLPRAADDEWAKGLNVISRLLDSVDEPESDLRLVIKQLDDLGKVQRDKIFRHLEMFLSGPIEDQIWERALGQIRDERMGDDRAGRVWMFFQPVPAGPRVRWPDPLTVTPANRFRVITAATLCAAAVGCISWLLLEHGNLLALFAEMVSMVTGYICFTNGLEWRHRVERRRGKDAEHRPLVSLAGHAPQGGFADNVDKLFRRYFARYVPDGTDQADWLAATTGIQKYLRDEIVEAYREKKIKSERIAWLVRYRVSDVKRCWQDGTLWDYRDQWRTPVSTKAIFTLGLAFFVTGGLWVVGSAVRGGPFDAAALALAAVSGWVASRGQLRIMLERRRYAAEYADSHQRLKASEAALARWKAKLARAPSDSEMAAWLDCDRKVLMDRAMRHYRLAPSEIIAHAFIEAPGASHKRARVRNGPWRYSRYQLLVFLLTTDGVRQVTADLEFEKGNFHDSQRINYRFDAVAALQAGETDDNRRTFELTLVNGQSIKVPVTESNTGQLQLEGEDAEVLSRIALDATGLANALHVLEGVAAEGKGWIRHEIRPREGQVTTFVSATHDE